MTKWETTFTELHQLKNNQVKKSLIAAANAWLFNLWLEDHEPPTNCNKTTDNLILVEWVQENKTVTAKIGNTGKISLTIKKQNEKDKIILLDINETYEI